MMYSTGLNALISYSIWSDNEEVFVQRKVTTLIDCLSNTSGLFGVFMIGVKLFAFFHEESLLKEELIKQAFKITKTKSKNKS
jgi:hypothetical protein